MCSQFSGQAFLPNFLVLHEFDRLSGIRSVMHIANLLYENPHTTSSQSHLSRVLIIADDLQQISHFLMLEHVRKSYHD